MSLFVDEEENPAQQRLSELLEQEGIARPQPPEEPEIPLRVEKRPEEVPHYLTNEVSQTTSLRFQQQIVRDMVENSLSSLLIFGRGLGWDILAANIIHSLAGAVELAHNNRKKLLIFVLNSRPDERIRLNEELHELNWLDGHLLPQAMTSITGELHNTAEKRRREYAGGGVIAITSRVLVADILSGTVDVKNITGLFILHAERASETLPESFVVNLYRDENEWGFIKAFSDEPELFTGFTPLASTLKNLRVQRVYLWPRFHIEVSASLTKHGRALTNRQKKEIEARRLVTEINVRMTSKQQKIQQALLSCIKACIMELKRHVPDLVTEYWDIANIHDPDFGRRIRAVIDQHSHRVSETAKQLSFDIGTLITFLRLLVEVDSVTYYQRVQDHVDANVRRLTNGLNTMMAPWLNLDESDTVISNAKARAFDRVTRQVGEETTEQYNLEEQPKWDQLAILLDDIMYEKSVLTSPATQGPVLIGCSTSQLAKELNLLLTEASVAMNPMTNRKRFLFRRHMERKLEQYQAWRNINDTVQKLNTTTVPNPTEVVTTKSFNGHNEPISKRRRTRGTMATIRVQKLYSDVEVDKTKGGTVLDPELLADAMSHLEEPIEVSDEDDDEEGDELFISKGPLIINIDKDCQVIIQSYNDRLTDSAIQEFGPLYIIMFDPNLAFIRRTEMYQANNKESPARVYLLYYGGSVEEERHLLTIKREKEAFTKLIREKGALAKSFDTSDDNWKFSIQKTQVLNTRIAGGSTFRHHTDTLKVVVDAREFRSDLPNLLYRVGITLVPVTLTVGDYVLSPKICVERKSIPDLIQSFKSGRLAQQCEQMFRNYELPCLLIEFDHGKSFSLAPFTESRAIKMRTKPGQSGPETPTMLSLSLQVKIMSLLVSYPKLKIIWLSSPYETAQIFLTLKANQDEPDIDEALSKGVNRMVSTEDDGPAEYNDGPIDLIQNIPGINNVNYHMIISKVRSIEELVKMPLEEFVDILGQENGRKAFNFINQAV